MRLLPVEAGLGGLGALGGEGEVGWVGWRVKGESTRTRGPYHHQHEFVVRDALAHSRPVTFRLPLETDLSFPSLVTHISANNIPVLNYCNYP